MTTTSPAVVCLLNALMLWLSYPATDLLAWLGTAVGGAGVGVGLTILLLHHRTRT